MTPDTAMLDRLDTNPVDALHDVGTLILDVETHPFMHAVAGWLQNTAASMVIGRHVDNLTSAIDVAAAYLNSTSTSMVALTPEQKDLIADALGHLLTGWYGPHGRVPEVEALCAATGLHVNNAAG